MKLECAVGLRFSEEKKAGKRLCCTLQSDEVTVMSPFCARLGESYEVGGGLEQLITLLSEMQPTAIVP